MYRMEINLDTRREYVNFYSLWTANQKAKEYAKCVDVIGLDIVDMETAEVMTIYQHGKLTWVSGVGDIDN